MRNILYFFLVAFILSSCSKNASNTKISGKLENPAKEKVYIQELTLSGKGFVDSTTLSGGGRFKFFLKLEQPAFYRVSVGKQRGITLIVQPKNKIRITGDANKLYETYNIEGSDESTYAQALDRRMDKTVKGIDSLNMVHKQFADNPNIVNITKTLQYNYYRFLDEQRKFTMDFVQKHPSSLASIMALYQQTDDSIFVLYKAEDTKYYAMVDSLIYPKFPKASYVKALHNNLQNIKDQQKQLELKKIMSALGTPAQNLTLPDASGKTVSLSSFKGNPLILYFWASWCDSCRKDNAEFIRIHEKYKSKGLKVLAVSLDLNKEVWQNAIKKDNIGSWSNVCDFKYWDSPAVALYNIENIPLIFLVDKDGTIISRSISPDAIDQRLDLLLK